MTLAHIVGYRDGRSYAYGGVRAVFYGADLITLCGDFKTVVLPLNQVLSVHSLPESHLSVQEYPNGWSHDFHQRAA